MSKEHVCVCVFENDLRAPSKIYNTLFSRQLAERERDRERDTETERHREKHTLALPRLTHTQHTQAQETEASYQTGLGKHSKQAHACVYSWVAAQDCGDRRAGWGGRYVQAICPPCQCMTAHDYDHK